MSVHSAQQLDRPSASRGWRYAQLGCERGHIELVATRTRTTQYIAYPGIEKPIGIEALAQSRVQRQTRVRRLEVSRIERSR
jgi:hypothetical protein